MDPVTVKQVGRAVDLCCESYTDSLRFTTFKDKTDSLTLGTYFDGDLYICFQGSRERSDWWRNLEFGKIDLDDDVSVHEGFFQHLNKFRHKINDYLKESLRIATESTGKIIICGHSLGGALATLYAYEIILKERPPLSPYVMVVTLGSPRVGDLAFKTEFNYRLKCFRLVYESDIVPRVPKFFYWHVGELLQLGPKKFFASALDHRPGKYQEEFDKTYRINKFGETFNSMSPL